MRREAKDPHADARAARIGAVVDAARKQMAKDSGGLRWHGETHDGYVRLELTGACERCPRAMMTLDVALETPLRALGVGIRGVELVHRSYRQTAPSPRPRGEGWGEGHDPVGAAPITVNKGQAGVSRARQCSVA